MNSSSTIPTTTDASVIYATYFDANYLERGLALYQSLQRHSGSFVLWVLCLDTETEQILRELDLPFMRLLPLAELEQLDPQLLATKADRLKVEYYWTCGPSFLLHLYRILPNAQFITYVDSDIYFFHPPELLQQKLGGNSILVIDHGYIDSRGGGRFNVGLLIFRRNSQTQACLTRWRDQCLEWCFDRFEQGKHGDQGYLDEWPNLYDVTILAPNAAGLAPWNILQTPVRLDPGGLHTDQGPLYFYHFARIRRVNRWVYELHDYRFHRTTLSLVVRRHLYRPYALALSRAEAQIRSVGGKIRTGSAHNVNTPAEAIRKKRAGDVPLTSLARYQRFMFVIGPWAL